MSMIRRIILLLIPMLVMLAQDATPWKKSETLEPAALAAMLKAPGEMPAILYVGFPVLYRGARIPGAVLAGPAAKPEGIDLIKQAVAKLPKNRNIVLYCGCCPFERCPNVRPAFQVLRDLGFTNVKLVIMPTNLHTDWVAKGYPVEKAAGAATAN